MGLYGELYAGLICVVEARASSANFEMSTNAPGCGALWGRVGNRDEAAWASSRGSGGALVERASEGYTGVGGGASRAAEIQY